jgi:hypothetical protein
MEEVSLKSKGHEKAASVKGFNKKSFAFSLVLVVIYTCLLKFAFDDGLRHVGLAFADVKSGHSWMSAVAHVWGEVYPFSYFEVFKD